MGCCPYLICFEIHNDHCIEAALPKYYQTDVTRLPLYPLLPSIHRLFILCTTNPPQAKMGIDRKRLMQDASNAGGKETE